MTTHTQSLNIKIIFTLTLVHFTGDFYSAFIMPLLPVFVDKLSLTLTQVGVIMGTVRFLAFVVQPTIGYLADQFPTRNFVIGGILLTVVFIPLAGVASSFWLLLLLLSIGAIGSSMFHPSVTGMVPLYSGGRSGFVMSIFNTGGTLAFGVGPLFITWYVTHFGLSAVPLTMLFGLTTLTVIYTTLPQPVSEFKRYKGFWGSLRQTIGPVWKAILLIWLVMVLRSMVGQSFLTFMPVLLAEKGHPLIGVGLIIALFVVAGTGSGLLAGLLSDRYGRKPVFLCTHALMAPALLLFLNASGIWVFVSAFAAGFFVLATLPLGVVLAQDLAPQGRSMVASLMMVLAYGLGGLFSPLVGHLADLYTIEWVLTYVALVPLFTLALIFLFPREDHRSSA